MRSKNGLADIRRAKLAHGVGDRSPGWTEPCPLKTLEKPTILTQPAESLDTTIQLVTPERILFRYPLAGPFRRLVAYFFDLALVTILLLLAVVASLAFLVSFNSTSVLGPLMVAYFILVWGYRGLCEAFSTVRRWGAPDGIRVVTDRGVPINGSQAVLRNLVGALDGVVPYLHRPDLTSLLLLTALTSMRLDAEVPEARRPCRGDDGRGGGTPDSSRDPAVR